jgi:hypothetical protein
MSANDPKQTLASPKSRNGHYGISHCARLLLLRLDVSCPDHLGPFLGFVGDELAEVGGRTRR